MADDIRDSFDWDGSKGRRAMASEKLAIYDSRYLAALQGVIKAQQTNADAGAQICKFANTSRNLLRMVTALCCIAYSSGCVRSLGSDVSEETARAFAEVVDESGIAEAAALINVYAWLLGPTFVIPQVYEDGTFDLDVIGPGAAECKRSNPRKPIDPLYQRPGDDGFFRLDADAWRFYTADGKPAPGLAPIVHGLGYVPAAIFRTKHWAGDWWNAYEHKALVDATYSVGANEARLHWSRKNGNKQPVIQAPRETTGGKQIIGHPELPLWFDCPPGQAQVDVIDLTNNGSNFLDQISATTAAICTLYGLPVQALTGVNNNGDWGGSIARFPEILDKLRDDQIPGMTKGEKSLWPAVCDLLRASTHKHAGALPPGDEVRDMLELTYLEPAVDPAKALAEIELFKEQEKLGTARVSDLVMRKRPEMTREQATAFIADNQAAALARWATLARNNQTAGTGDAVQTIAEAQGRIGGLTKADNAAAEQTDE